MARPPLPKLPLPITDRAVLAVWKTREGEWIAIVEERALDRLTRRYPGIGLVTARSAEEYQQVLSKRGATRLF